jgi:hypothetical protein
MLRKLRRRKFSHVRVAGADALLAFVPNEGEVAPAVRERLNLPCDQRWYPTDAGHLVKWSHQGEPFDSQEFRLEAGGWDHEHCSVCNDTIRVNEECWITERGSFVVLCRACHRRLARLRRA